MSRYGELLDEIQALEEEIADLEGEDTSKHECADFHRGKLEDLRFRLEVIHEELYDCPIE